jgi:hypothetical protein
VHINSHTIVVQNMSVSLFVLVVAGVVVDSVVVLVAVVVVVAA